MLILALFLVFCSVGMGIYFVVPYLFQTSIRVNKERARTFAREMDRTMMNEDIQKVRIFYVLAPFALATGGFLMMALPGLVAGAVLGFVLPRVYANVLMAQRKKQFETQLIDALMIMSSSFRGGLSLIQSMEAVVEEMSDPIRQEFMIVLGENKMGVSFDEALSRLYKRMPSPALQQMVSAILLARETGGNLPLIFSRIVSTIRESNKIAENLNVLTLQGKLQAFVMSGLPVAFFFMVKASNPDYFKVMMVNDLGRILLVLCLVLWLVGTFLILKISTFKEV